MTLNQKATLTTRLVVKGMQILLKTAAAVSFPKYSTVLGDVKNIFLYFAETSCIIVISLDSMCGKRMVVC